MSAAERHARTLKRARRAFWSARSRFAHFLTRFGTLRVSPRFTGWRWISALILVLFAIQLVSGILLSLYYEPEPTEAYDSTRLLVGQVSSGWFLRSLHSWTAEFLILAITVHLLVAFFRRAYQRPRDYMWVSAVFLLIAFLAFRFTGRLLPWDTLGYEASVQGLQLIRQVPLLGPLTASWLRGGPEFGTGTLNRFFTTHVLLLPWITFFLLAIHGLILHRLGFKGGKR